MASNRRTTDPDLTRRPTRTEILAAEGKTVPDVITPGLKVLFCGINPGLYTAVIGHHFGRPGNRFWPALFAAGITPRLLSPYEERELLHYGYGITNLVARATATADQITKPELLAGSRILVEKAAEFKPSFLAVLGLTAYRTAFGEPAAQIGLQTGRIAGAKIWVLPNPSGLNAHYTLPGLARLFAALKEAVEAQ